MSVHFAPQYSPNPSISYVVASYNHPKRLEACLLALRQSIYPNYEIIVADDGSSDPLVQKTAKKYGAKWVTGDRLYIDGISTRTISANLNRAWPLCDGEIIQTLQQDHILAPDFGLWLARTFSPSMLMIGATHHTPHEFTKKDVEALLSAVHLPDGDIRYETYLFAGRATLVEVFDWRYMDGLNLAFHRHYIDIGGANMVLDESMVGSGHFWMDWIQQLIHRGVRLVYNPLLRLWDVTQPPGFYIPAEPWAEQIDASYKQMQAKWGENVWLIYYTTSWDARPHLERVKKERGMWV